MRPIELYHLPKKLIAERTGMIVFKHLRVGDELQAGYAKEKSMRNAILSTIILLCGAGSLRADLITNGSFETGDLTGWTTSDWGVVKGAEPPILNAAENGTYVAYGTSGGLSQKLTTVSGQSYTLSFYYDIGACVVVHDSTCADSPRDDLTVLWGSTTAFDTGSLVGNSTTDPGWVHESITVVASSSSTALDFSVTTDGALPLYIDNVSVTANTTVPEPSSIMLLSTVLGVLALILHRRCHCPA